MTGPLAIATLVVVLASYIMLTAGTAKRRLVWRNPRCPVCHHPRSNCICHWR
ncbi:MAG TPA: hypothetical protein VGH52_01370 [Gaiellaceae bacterium]|jgi:hypothetical protein